MDAQVFAVTMVVSQAHTEPQLTELYTVNMYSSLHVSHMTVKWFKK